LRTIVLGPPGTGKTTTLLNKVDDYLKQTDPDKIGYFAFTQKAAHEARDRAIKKFNLTEDDLPYFRTLHSLAFRKLGLKKDQVMQPRHYKDLGKKLDGKATSQFPNYPKDAIHRRKPDTIDGQVFANGEHEFAVKPMIDWLEGNNKYWSGLKYQLSKPVKAYPTNSRGKPIELDD